jgi:electron transport complex protein RnfA
VKEFLSIIIGTALVNNLILGQLLGVSSFFSSTSRLATATSFAVFSAIIMICSTLINYLIFQFVLLPAGLEFLQLLAFLLTSAVLTLTLLKVMQGYFPISYRQHWLPFFMVGGNSAVIGLSLTINRSPVSFLECLAYSLGAATGFALVLILFAAIRERTELADVPRAFRGIALDMICAGLAAMAFLGFAGIV